MLRLTRTEYPHAPSPTATWLRFLTRNPRAALPDEEIDDGGNGFSRPSARYGRRTRECGRRPRDRRAGMYVPRRNPVAPELARLEGGRGARCRSRPGPS